MKKVMLVIVCLVFAASAFAQQSDPSNDVGYVKLNINGSGTPGTISTLAFGLPFKFWNVNAGVPQYGNESTRPSSIIGAQTNPGAIGTADRISRVDAGTFAYFRSSDNTWQGTLETAGTGGMIPGRGYQYVNKTGAARVLVLAGDVDNSGDYGIVTVTAPTPPALLASTPYSWRDSRNVAVSALNLLEDGFTGGAIGSSDRVAQTVGGAFAYYRTSDNTWQGLAAIVPGQYYNIVNKHAVWSYSYDGTAAAAMNASVALPAVAPVTKMPVSKDVPAVKTSSVKSSKGASASK